MGENNSNVIEKEFYREKAIELIKEIDKVEQLQYIYYFLKYRFDLEKK